MRYILVLSTFCIWKNRQRELSSFPKVIVLARIVVEVEFESRKTEFQTSFNKWSLPPPVPAFLLSWESLFIIPQVIQNKFQHFNLTHRALLLHEKLFLFILISWHFHPWILCWITSNLLTFPIEDAMMIYILYLYHIFYSLFTSCLVHFSVPTPCRVIFSLALIHIPKFHSLITLCGKVFLILLDFFTLFSENCDCKFSSGPPLFDCQLWQIKWYLD